MISKKLVENFIVLKNKEFIFLNSSSSRYNKFFLYLQRVNGVYYDFRYCHFVIGIDGIATAGLVRRECGKTLVLYLYHTLDGSQP